LGDAGIATAEVRAIVPHGFASLPLNRIEAYVYANNPASARVRWRRPASPAKDGCGAA
jgi:hypothetical protein